MEYIRENRLIHKGLVYEDLIKLFTVNNVRLAGGAITSIFSGAPINDYDIYFKTIEERNTVINFFSDDDNGITLLHTTANALTYNISKTITIQLITEPDFIFKDPHELFNTFDFTVCMGSYCFADGDFTLNGRFLQDLANKRLFFNEHSRNPLQSLWRVQKYVNRGFVIESPELIKIALAFAMQYKNMDTLMDIQPYIQTFNRSAYLSLTAHINTNGNENIKQLLNIIDTFNIIDPIGNTSNGY